MSEVFKYLKILRKPNEKLVPLLEANVIGTPGKSMVYRHLMVPEKLRTLPDPRFAVLQMKDKIQGAICFSRRTVYNGNAPQTALYIRYFTFLEALRSGVNPERKKISGRSQLREEVARLMNGEGLEHQGDLLLYAYLDNDNIRSRRLIDEFGFKFACQLRILSFSRLFPRHDKRVKKLPNSHDAELISRLRDFYAGHMMATFVNLMKKGQFFVIKEEGRIVCGVQAYADAWEIREAPGFSGKVILKVIPRIPLLRRLFRNPFRFVTFDNIFYTPVGKKYLPALLSSVLADFNLNIGLLCLDPSSEVYNCLKSINLGIIHKFMGESRIELVVKSSGGFKIPHGAPVYVAGHDVF